MNDEPEQGESEEESRRGDKPRKGVRGAETMEEILSARLSAPIEALQEDLSLTSQREEYEGLQRIFPENVSRNHCPDSLAIFTLRIP